MPYLSADRRALRQVSSGLDDPVKFVARQPILDGQKKIYGYELLFRSGFENSCDKSSPNPTLAVIADGVLFHDLKTLVDNRKVFVKFSREAFLADYASLLPREFAVIEILEGVEPDPQVLTILHRLKDSGYSMALDDVTSSDRLTPFLGLVQFAKVDLSLTTLVQRQELARLMILNGICPIAEKVETEEQFREAAAAGYQFFQGYFFAKPQIISGRDIRAFDANYLRLLQVIHRPYLNIKELARLIKCEEAFCYKLLRYLNSPVFGFKSTIHSVRHAISLVGEKEIKRWASLLAVTLLASDKPEELVLTSLRRAFFCESLAPSAGMGSQKESLFLLGLLSLIDAILDRPRAEVLSELPIEAEIKSALLEGKNRLAVMLELVETYDKAGWPQVVGLARTLRVGEPAILSAYLKSLKLSREAVPLS